MRGDGAGSRTSGDAFGKQSTLINGNRKRKWTWMEKDERNEDSGCVWLELDFCYSLTAAVNNTPKNSTSLITSCFVLFINTFLRRLIYFVTTSFGHSFRWSFLSLVITVFGHSFLWSLFSSVIPFFGHFTLWSFFFSIIPIFGHSFLRSFLSSCNRFFVHSFLCSIVSLVIPVFGHFRLRSFLSHFIPFSVIPIFVVSYMHIIIRRDWPKKGMKKERNNHSPRRNELIKRAKHEVNGLAKCLSGHQPIRWNLGACMRLPGIS